MTLHRLRKLLNSNNAINLANGKLSINRKLVWLDVTGFLDSVNIKTIINDEYTENIFNYLEYYNGEFLANEPDSYWLLAMREKLRNRYLSLVEMLGSYFLKKGNFENAINIYEEVRDMLKDYGWKDQSILYKNQIKLTKQKLDKDRKLREIESQKREKDKAYHESLKAKKIEGIDKEKARKVEEKRKEDEEFQAKIDEMVTEVDISLRD